MQTNNKADEETSFYAGWWPIGVVSIRVSYMSDTDTLGLYKYPDIIGDESLNPSMI